MWQKASKMPAANGQKNGIDFQGRPPHNSGVLLHFPFGLVLCKVTAWRRFTAVDRSCSQWDWFIMKSWHVRFFHGIVLTGALLLVRPYVQAREWTSGSFKIEAELVEIKDEKAVLRKPDGKLVTIPVAKLSQADQDFLKMGSKPTAAHSDDDDAFGSVEGLPPPEIISGGKSTKTTTKSPSMPAEGATTKTTSEEPAAADTSAPKFAKITYSDPTFVGIVRTLTPDERNSASYTSVVFSPNGGWLAVGGGGESVALYDINHGKILSTHQFGERNYSDNVSAMAFTPDGKRLIAATEKGSVNIYRVSASGQLTVAARFLGHDGKVNTVSITPDGKFGVSGGDDKTFRLWRIADGEEVKAFTGFKDEVSCSWISEDGARAIASDGKVAGLYDLPQKRFVKAMTISKSYSDVKVSISPSGTYMAAKDYETLAIIEVRTGNPFPLSTKFSFGRFPPIFSKDGKTLAVANSSTIDLWDWRNGRKVQSFSDSSIQGMAFSPDSKHLATVEYREAKIYRYVPEQKPVLPAEDEPE